jgi:hypothetical protein
LAAFAVPALIGTAKADIIDCTIHDIQDTSSVLWDTLVVSGPVPDTLRTTGVVTGADTKPTGLGFYIEDFSVGPQFRGLDVFTGSHNAFVDSSLVRGQLVRVTGRYTTFNGQPEIISMNGASFGDSVRIEHNLGIPGIPGPTVLTTADIGSNTVNSHFYQGMFVKVNHQIRCTNTTSLPFGTWQGVDNTVVGPTDTVLVDMNVLANPTVGNPAVGQIASFLQGIYAQFAVNGRLSFRIQIRDGADIVVSTPPSVNAAYAISPDSIRVVFDRGLDPVSAQNVANYSRALTLKAIDSATLYPDPNSGINQIVDLYCASDPMTPGEAESLVVSGVKSSINVPMATAQGRGFFAGLIKVKDTQTSLNPYNGPGGSDTTQYQQWANKRPVTVRAAVTAHLGTLVWLEDPAGGLRSGVKFFSPATPMSEGDDVTIVGYPTEFFDETEFSGAIFERNHGPGSLPPPIEIPAANLAALNDTVAAGGTREDYEGCLVRLHDVAVDNDSIGFGEWRVKRGGDCWEDASCPDTLDIGARGFGLYSYTPMNGSQLSSLEGPVEISFDVLKVEPREDSDFVVAGGTTGVDHPVWQLALASSGTNPFSFGRGTMRFTVTMPSAGKPTLALYDIRGRLVNTLLSGKPLSAGPNSVEWRGTDNAGHRVSSGIYFGQLRLGNKIALAKVVVAN